MKGFGRIACKHELQAPSTMIQTLRFIAVSLLTAFLLTSPVTALAGSDKHAHAINTVQKLFDDAHAAMSGRSGRDLPSAISPYLAFDYWARVLIQPRKEVFTPKQQRILLELLPGYFANLYHEQFSQGLNTKPKVGHTKRTRKDVLVSSKFPRTRGKPLPINWRVRTHRNGSSWVIDIVIGGTSFVLLKREEFTAIIDKHGPEGLLEYLRRNSSKQ